ncbi:MAG: [FeFe] hydrogenase H-cluster maturation GTPase HydF [Bacillota bacterium]
MNKTPNANRKHIAIYGKTNSGKSSLLNAIVGQEISIVSHIKGTTTDPVTKAMELIPFGPVVFIDTAGLDDKGELGSLRVKKSLKVLQRTDFAIYILDIKDRDLKSYQEALKIFKKYNIPYMTVINKIDTSSKEELEEAKMIYKDAVFVSALKEENILFLKDELIKRLHEDEVDPPIIGDIIPYNGKVVMVVPVDSEAPKGRLILPQVQLIRDCLDHGIKSYVVRDTELEGALQDLQDIDLVVTDSQVFKKVNEIVPEHIKLTSFSILFARYKGDIEAFIQGVKKVEELNENSIILISESCTHNHSHEDIGRIKIPTLLNNHVGKKLNYEFKMGHDFPEDIEAYDLVIHCGSCMLNRKTMQTRVDMCLEKGTAITNYGVMLAYLNGILDRCIPAISSPGL